MPCSSRGYLFAMSRFHCTNMSLEAEAQQNASSDDR